MSEEPDLQALREAIESLDREVLGLLRERLRLVEQVATRKLAQAYPFRDAPREDSVLRRIRKLAAGLGLDAHEIERLYRQILAMSVAHQEAHVRSLPTVPLRVGYQGVEGSYSHLAAQRRYAGRPGGTLLTGYPSFRAVVENLLAGVEDFGWLPIENTTAGSIDETYDLLAEGGITITGEEIRSIDHCLLGLPGASLESLGVVLSHPQALLQCRRFLAERPWLEPRAEFDTAGAARKVRDLGDPRTGAIASLAAGRSFGLEVLAQNIQDQSGNFTRFVEVARVPLPCPEGVPCKTSLLLSVGHTPGSLAEVLAVFSRRRINLTKLESRPVPESPWEYRFHVDLEGHAASANLSEALAEIRPRTRELRVLGSYPKALDSDGPPSA